MTDPNDGVALLLDLLKIYRRGNQQEHLGHPLTLRNNKDRQQIIKKNMVSCSVRLSNSFITIALRQ